MKQEHFSLDYALAQLRKNCPRETDHRGLTRPEESHNAWAPALLRALEEAFRQCEYAAEHAQSPIEELFLAALWASPFLPNKHIESGHGCSAWLSDPSDPDQLSIEAQAKVGTYRVDFLLTLRCPHQGASAAKLAIECDGHDFHEKTKAQAAHDKKRDRFFASVGLPVLRFTGSEIHKNAAGCVGEAIALLVKLRREAAVR